VVAASAAMLMEGPSLQVHGRSRVPIVPTAPLKKQVAALALNQQGIDKEIDALRGYIDARVAEEVGRVSRATAENRQNVVVLGDKLWDFAVGDWDRTVVMVFWLLLATFWP
jgi:hypothetical protein